MGNIGAEYAMTRHNIGFMCLNEYARRYRLTFTKKKYYDSIISNDTLLIKPKTYMNLSGRAYEQAKADYGEFDEICVITDDIDLPTGQIRLRTSGGDGGHNGLKSLIQCIGHNEFPRLRIGIGRPTENDARDYVLDTITHEEMEVFSQIFHVVTAWIKLYIKRDFKTLLDEYSQWKKNPIPPQTETGS